MLKSVICQSSLRTINNFEKETTMRFQLASYGHAFATRPRGAELLGALEEQVSYSNEAVIDFEGVRSVSYSFADEFIAELLQRVEQGTCSFSVQLDNVAPELRSVICMAISKRGLNKVDVDELFALAVS